MQLTDEQSKVMDKARIGYEEYCNYTGWKSAVTGDPLPQWEQLPGAVVNAWFAAAQVIAMSEWRPIKTASKDATKIIVYGKPIDPFGRPFPSRVHIAWWEAENHRWIPESMAAWTEPSHWVPLPEPPNV